MHAAARIAALAGEAQIIASATTIVAAGESAEAGKRSTVLLKGITRPVEVVSVEWR